MSENNEDAPGDLVEEHDVDKTKGPRRVRINGCLYYIPQGMSFKEWVEFRKEMGLAY